jgi:peptidoglycan hydrolase-like protein with peptidoglycan-binding domain
METLRDLNTDRVMERAISTENVSPAPEQRTATGKFASADSSSHGPLPETMKPALVLPAVPFTEEDVRQVQSRLHDLGYLSSPINGRWDARSKTAVQEFKLANRLANDDVLDLATREKLNSPLALRVDQSFLGKWCRPAGPKKLRLTINSRGTNSSTGSKCVFHKIQAENGGWRLRATCSEGSESWNATGKITATGSKLVWASERDVMKYSRCN